MSQPSVSVIIPTYNRRALLREALDSVHNQTYRDFETIVVDDGSTEEYGNGIADHPLRPSVIHQSHQGPAQARNRGLSEAAADVVAFLDSDDLWQPTKLETFMHAMNAEPDVNIFYGPMRPIDSRGNTVPGRTKPCHNGQITERLFCSSFVHVPTVVCRKRVLLDANGFNSSLPVCEDYDLWLRLSVRESFFLIAEPLALRRLHPDRLSKDQMSRNLRVKSDVLRGFYESDMANGHLDKAVAESRLSRVLFSAARAALREGQYEQALELCHQSRGYGSSRMRTIPIAFHARAMTFLMKDSAAARSPS